MVAGCATALGVCRARARASLLGCGGAGPRSSASVCGTCEVPSRSRFRPRQRSPGRGAQRL